MLLLSNPSGHHGRTVFALARDSTGRSILSLEPPLEVVPVTPGNTFRFGLVRVSVSMLATGIGIVPLV